MQRVVNFQTPMSILKIDIMHVDANTVYLTHISLASHFRDIGKQCRPRSDAAEHCLLTGISIRNKIEMKSTPDTPKMGNGLV